MDGRVALEGDYLTGFQPTTTPAIWWFTHRASIGGSFK
jgi:hypothetical protein